MGQGTPLGPVFQREPPDRSRYSGAKPAA